MRPINVMITQFNWPFSDKTSSFINVHTAAHMHRVTHMLEKGRRKKTLTFHGWAVIKSDGVRLMRSKETKRENLKKSAARKRLNHMCVHLKELAYIVET